MTLLLRKAKIVRKITSSLYEAEDLLNQELMTVQISGKLRMNYFVLKDGEQVFVLTTEEKPDFGRLIIEKYICMDYPKTDICQQKHAIEQALKEKQTNQ